MRPTLTVIDNFMKQKPHQLYDEFKEKHDEEWKWLNEGLSSTALCGSTTGCF
ncbi:hypothetical protein PS15m_008746 [Mucor circinelloides]